MNEEKWTQSNHQTQINPNSSQFPITISITQLPKFIKPQRKPKFNTSKIIKPNTIRSTTNQDHRILHILPQILTQSTSNSPANQTHTPSNQANLQQTHKPIIKPKSQNHYHCHQPTDPKTTTTTTDQHNQT